MDKRLDVAGAYPNNGSVFNVSRETTHTELISIAGVTEAQQRTQGLNISAGHVNAVEIVTELYGLPTMEMLLSSFEKKNAAVSI